MPRLRADEESDKKPRTPVITAEQFTREQGEGLWSRASSAVDAHLGMLEMYAMSGIPGCSISQLTSLRDQIDNIIQTIEEQKPCRTGKNMLTVNLPSSQTHPLVKVTIKNADGPDYDDTGRFSLNLRSGNSEGGFARNRSKSRLNCVMLAANRTSGWNRSS